MYLYDLLVKDVSHFHSGSEFGYKNEEPNRSTGNCKTQSRTSYVHEQKPVQFSSESEKGTDESAGGRLDRGEINKLTEEKY